MEIPAQEVITRDNVTIRLNAVAYFRVVDPSAAVVNVADYSRAVSSCRSRRPRSVARSVRRSWMNCSPARA